MQPTDKAVIFSAPSGSGKTTIVRALLETDIPMEFSISATSRDPRGAEKDGIDYHFLSVDEFKDRINRGELFEWEEVYDNQFYGTLHSELDRIWNNGKAVVFDVDVYGGVNLKKTLGDQALSIFVKPPSIAALEERLKKRNTDSIEKIKTRLAKAEEELAMSSSFDFVIVNDSLEEAIKQTKQVIEAFLK